MSIDTEQDEQVDQDEIARRLGRGGNDDQQAMGRAYAADSTPAPTPATASPDTDAPMVSPAIGNAYKPAAGEAASPAAKSLGEFAAATGANIAPPPTHMSQVAPPPQAPTMERAYATTQADLRSKSAVTPKFDPQTGQTLDKYKPGIGSRIGRAFLDAGRGFLYGGLGGMVAAPLEGAFGNKNSPGYYGAGAVNGQYFKDETQRKQAVDADSEKLKSFEAENKQAQEQFKDKNDIYKDSLGQAYKQDLQDVKQQTETEKERHNQETEDLKRQLQEATTPEAKLKAEIAARTSIAKQLGLTGRDAQLYQANGKLPDDDTIQRRLKIEEERVGIERDRAARQSGEDGGQWHKTPGELADYKSRTAPLDREAGALESRKALYTEGGTADPSAQDALKRINDRLNAIGKEKDTIRQSIISNRPSKQTNSTAPDDSTIEQPIADARTGQPLPGIAAHTNDGAEAAAVVGAKDSRGRPTIEIQPKASAPKLTPIQDKSVKTAKGKVLNIGDDIPGHGKIKGFGKDASGKINAMF